MFQRGVFKLYKWHSNEQALETNDAVNEKKLNVAKQHLGTKPKETKIPGILWDKREDSFIIQVSDVNKNATKRNILSTLLYGQPLLVPEEDLDKDVPETRGRQRCINKCKDAAWTRWTKEYLKALRERQNMLHQANKTQI